MEPANHAVVIMFTDVVGYTSMMGADEAHALDVIQQNRAIQISCINAYQGTFVKEMGDGILAYFQDVENAVKCAIEIQANARESFEEKVRIGIHMGNVILDNDDIFGDDVNIASRIESLAEPGGIYISDKINDTLKSIPDITIKELGKAKLKNVSQPVTIYAVTGDQLPVPSKSRFKALADPPRKFPVTPAIAVFSLILIAVIYFTVNFFGKRTDRMRAEASLTEIERLVENSWRDYSEAYDLVKQAEKHIPQNTKLQELLSKASVQIDVTTDPPGAEVFIKKYDSPEHEWNLLGTTPLDSVQLPITILRWKIEKKGYETVLAASTTFDIGNIRNMEKHNMLVPKNFHRKLDRTKSIPEGMSRVSGSAMPYGKLDDFFIDKYEVTNRQYKVFVDAGGYENPEFWQHEIIHNGRSISWTENMSLFTDQTGLSGPSTWKNGTYPEGKAGYPVGGVSWYEAAAYANYAGKTLPTGDHWGLARGEAMSIIRWPQLGGYALFVPFSNFNQEGPVEAGTLNGLTSFGTYDMAGNVREWCWNKTPKGGLMRGGAWNTNTYAFGHPQQAPLADRSPTNGFRAAVYMNHETVPAEALRLFEVDTPPVKIEPISEEQFQAYRRFYAYDKTTLQAEVEIMDDTHPDWTHEKITFNAAYGNERVIAHLIVPRNARPPYQTIIYGPGSASLYQLNSDHITDYYEFPVFLDYIVKSGRAVLYPVIKGTFERTDDVFAGVHFGNETHLYSEFLTMVIKDYRRSIDYLETREDVDPDKIAFYGMSWGPSIGTILSGVEERIKANVFISGGLRTVGLPEVNAATFVTRVDIPTLMINGRYDSMMPLESHIQPLHDLLGTPEPDKKLVLSETDHIPPREWMVRETLVWLDKYLGPVDGLSDR